ncbi:MAG TPA: hypothetical protein VFX20_13930 [Steroidobacteraceae bacterium]|nr:hypothetical protein [Steroidobacteraceae bacterium]
MAFAERALKFTFSGDKTGTLEVAGLRAVANIDAVDGRLGVSAQVKIWGLSMGQMNAYSSRLASGVGVNQFGLTIEAGYVGEAMSTVIKGAIWRSYVDLQGTPESAFDVSVVETILTGAQTIAGQSQPGAQNAEDLIGSICKAAALTLHNQGAHAVLRNPSTNGSIVDQIEYIADAAGFTVYFEGSNVWIYPKGGNRDDVVIDVGPDTGMVGYPAYWESGLIVRSLFDQRIQVGRQMRVTSSIPKANGTWQIIRVQHELATMMRDGPWFTTAVLTTSDNNA